ncbi:MAG: hypothetical protein DRH12_19525 [Deltaproteobacteria bacterium]|nr:MAG: hypothetical protein DRH12_19525 [Deltaproteobacteria bacterium]
MVFARTKISIEDNCFEEEPGGVEMRYIGPGVPKLYNKMYELMKAVFQVSDADIQETEYSWGKTDKGDKFKVRWWIHKDLDVFSYLYIRVDISGEGDLKMGSAKIGIRGLLRTEYPQDTVWQRSLFYEMLRTFWHRVFYHKKREEYAEECRHSTILFERKLKEFMEELKSTSS